MRFQERCYLVVLQNVYVMSFEHPINLVNPKSQSLIYPSLSSKTFSSIRSLNNYFCYFETPTGSLHDNNWFSLKRNEKKIQLCIVVRMESITDQKYWSISGGDGWSNTWTIKTPPRFETIGRHFIYIYKLLSFQFVFNLALKSALKCITWYYCAAGSSSATQTSRFKA